MIIEIRPGEGGTDAALFASQLHTTLSAYALRLNRKVEDLTSDTRQFTLKVSGSLDPFLTLTGTHRIQRIPTGETRRHTSTASVAVLDSLAAPQVFSVPDSEFHITRTRGTGPGGQNKNKRFTACRVVHTPSGLVATRNAGRSIDDNIHSAKMELTSKLRDQHLQSVALARNSLRTSQVAASDRSSKTFTHNSQRGTVVDHTTGKTWRLADFAKGKI